jgi:hypothetical protein
MTPEEQMADIFADALEQVTRPLVARIRELEQRPALNYEGVWSEGKVFGRGQTVTHDGSLWLARDASVGRRPGTDPDSWTLIVKRGRDGARGR